MPTTLHKIQRVTLGLYALAAGACSVLTLILPRVVCREILGTIPVAMTLIFCQLYGGMRLGLALVALIAAFSPKPPRALVWAVVLALWCGLIGVTFSSLVATVGWPDLKLFGKWLALDALVAPLLLVTQLVREAQRRPRA